MRAQCLLKQLLVLIPVGMLLFLLAGCGGGGGQAIDSQYFQKIIIPGQGMAGVHLGDTYGSVKRVLGVAENDSMTGWQIKIWPHGLAIYFDDTNNNGICDDPDRCRSLVAQGMSSDEEDNYLGHTSDGIPLAATRNQVRSAYGTPNYAYFGDWDTEHRWPDDCYMTRGIQFGYRLVDGIYYVQDIQVFNPGDMEVLPDDRIPDNF